MSKYLRRGFKVESEFYAGLYRKEMGLADYSPLCPRMLAEHLGVPIRRLSCHPGISEDVRAYWQNNSTFSFSGLITCDGTYKEILYNDFHSIGRQNSNISHELSHIILGHPMTVPIKENGERDYHASIEEEAKWLGAALLIPKKATLHILLNSLSVQNAAYLYGVSESLLKYRLQVTDAYRYAENVQKKYRR